ncbi:MAG: type II toxin-antitoxin system death-on-curing family toxin [Mycobacteriales bacterium]
MIFLDVDDLLHIANRILAEVDLRDVGLLESAAARHRTSALGADAYPTVHHKAAALVHSIARNHALVDGNKRLALGALLAFYGVNGYRSTMTNDEAYTLIMAIASAARDDVQPIAATLLGFVEAPKKTRRRR